MAFSNTQQRRPIKRRRSFISYLLLFLIALPILVPGFLWLFGPALIAPRDDFTQGPGGSVAYVSLLNQLRTQSNRFAQGAEIHLTMTEDEFSGMVASALLSGRQPQNPLRKVRAGLGKGEIRVDTILDLSDPRVPERFKGKAGLDLFLRPSVQKSGLVSFEITSVRVGRMPVPVWLIRNVSQWLHLNVPGFRPEEPAIEIPLGEVLSGQLRMPVRFKQVTVNPSQIELVVSRGQ